MNNISGFSSACDYESAERPAAGGFPPLLIAAVIHRAAPLTP